MTRSGAAKPRVLLVDDHPEMLDRVSALLAGDFEIAGAATDPLQAIEDARRLDPDLIVLDINMPRLNGFQTLHVLKQAGCRASAVFLSVLDEEPGVAEAFRRGARGYVLKSNAPRDLASALDHVGQGRMFVPSLPALLRLADGPGSAHATQLCGELSSSVASLAAFFEMALRRGDATCLIAPEDVRDAVTSRLRGRGYLGPSGFDRFRCVDTAEALSRIMRNDRLDAALVAESVAELDGYRRRVTDGGAGRLTVFGNMAARLMIDRNFDAAAELERRWSALTRELPFFTVCGYDTSCLHDDAPDVWSTASAEHWAVSHAPDRW